MSGLASPPLAVDVLGVGARWALVGPPGGGGGATRARGEGAKQEELHGDQRECHTRSPSDQIDSVAQV